MGGYDNKVIFFGVSIRAFFPISKPRNLNLHIYAKSLAPYNTYGTQSGCAFSKAMPTFSFRDETFTAS